MTKLLVPSAGKAQRFRNTIKELLPIDHAGNTLLENAINTGISSFFVDSIHIITNALKEPYHRHILDRNNYTIPITFTRQIRHELWGAIQDGLTQENTLLLLPDTVPIIPPVTITAPFMLGVFQTDEPQRFSSVYKNRIYTKKPIGTMAWGAVYWSAEVALYFNQLDVPDYDTAFNVAIQRYGLTTFPIHSYHDLGSMAHYIDYIKQL